MSPHPSASTDDEIRRAIRDGGGAISFQRFMELALYGVAGFYTRPEDNDLSTPTGTGGSAGRRGDFITSPEVGPLFGAVFARMLDSEWRRLGEPERFVVIELGAGPGTLARSIIAAEPACLDAVEYIAVEVSARQRAGHPDTVRSVPSMADSGLGDDPAPGVVIANEVLDNVPFRLVVFDGAWREASVIEGDAGFQEVLGAPLDPVPAALPPRAAHGSRAPLQVGAARLVVDACSCLSAGSAHIIDYCRPRTALLAGLPWREWLRTYRGHERGGHYLADPGAQDITADVAIDQLPEPDGVRTQAQFLQRWGIDELVDEGRQAWTAAASRPTLDAIRMRSRISEASALLDPEGLGGFTVLEYRR